MASRLIGLVVTANVVLSLDTHIFYIRAKGTNNCITAKDTTISTDVECSEWRSQEWLFNSASSKILSVQEVGKCLGYSTDFYLIGCDDSNSTSPINSATLIPGSDYNIGSTTYEIFRPADHNNAVPVPSSTCVYEEFSPEARNIDYTPSAKKGFEEDETISWSCKKGHRFPDNTDTVISKCQANGTFSHTNLSCSKVTCPHPLEGVQSSPYKLVDNELVRIDQQHAKDDIFLFDDEIVYRCNDTFRSVNDGPNRVTATCLSDGTWSTNPLNCWGECDYKQTISSGEQKCGYFKTPNFPENYENKQGCNWMLYHEDLDVRFNAYIPFLELEFSSKFSNYCFKDRLLFVSYLPNDVTNQADTQEVCQHTKDRDKNKAASDAQWRSLSSTTNNFTIKFHSSAEMNREGAVVEWWTDNMQKSDRPDHCKYLSELPTPSQDSIDTKYGRMSDYYHMVYIGFIFILTILFAYWLVKKIYSCCFGLEKTNSGVISDSEDDDDWDDQYDPDEPDDDVDDFSLLTLLEMKANREELETAVNDLSEQIEQIEEVEDETDDMVTLNTKPSANNNRRMSNIGKIKSQH